jgi:hypothetical protein
MSHGAQSRRRSPLVRALGLLAALLPLLATAPTARAQEPYGAQTLDEGRLVISQEGRKVRVEEFALQRLSDTLLVRAASHGWSAPGQPEHKVDKTCVLMVGALDYAMGTYTSTLAAGPDTLKRGITVAAGDTLYTEWRELDQEGRAEVKVMPAGRLYILDPPLFTTFSIIGRSLNGKSCDHRPITVMVLGNPSDSILTAIVNDLGNETIAWGGRRVVARKLTIADEHTSFTAWVALDGRLLRLEQPRAALVIEREAPAARRAAAPARRATPPARRSATPPKR